MVDKKAGSVAGLEADLRRLGVPLEGLDIAWTAHVRDEIDRYLGWPGQAPAYKLGERLWLAVRDEAKQRRGAAFDLKTFHRQVLELGPMGLDMLRSEITRL